MGLRVGARVGLRVPTLHRPLSPTLNLTLRWLRLNHSLHRSPQPNSIPHNRKSASYSHFGRMEGERPQPPRA